MYTSQAETDLLTDINVNKVSMTGLHGALSTNGRPKEDPSPSRAQEMIPLGNNVCAKAQESHFFLKHSSCSPIPKMSGLFTPRHNCTICPTSLECSLRFLSTQSNSYSSFTFQLKRKAMAATSLQRRIKSVPPLSSRNTWVHRVGAVHVLACHHHHTVSSQWPKSPGRGKLN